jgi:type I restriction enzyme R subunit
LSTKEAVELHSADAIDLKRYEPEMRRLIDTFIRADFARPLSSLEDMSLVDLIAERQVDPDNAMPWGLRGSRDNVAETIDNNVRRLIIDETPVNPRFYEKLSTLLSDLVDQRRQNAIEYSMYLDQIAELARLAKQGHDHTYPEKIETPGQRALYDNLDQDADRAARVDRIIRENALDGFRENAMKQRQLKRALAEEISDPHEIDRVIEIVTQHAEY